MTEEKKRKTLQDISKELYEKGLAAAGEGKYDEAIGLLENLNCVLPIFVASALQTGRCHWEMHRWEPARKYFEIANRLDPVNDDAGWTLGLLALQMGDFKTGWEGYERRWGSKTFKSPRLSTIHPQWERGLGLKRPIVWTEQGIGDQILYASLIEKLAKEAEEVTVLIDMRLAGLLQRGCKAKNVRFLPHNAKIKMTEHDSHIPIASMGKYFINSVWDILDAVSSRYIKADPHRVKALRKELALSDKDCVVGLAWTSTAPIIGQHKSVPLASFKPILDMPGTKFINLQYGKAQEEGRGFHPDLITTHIDTFLDLENTAALIELCDVIISPSCATVHIAGAMGKDVLLLDANKLWYWNNRLGITSMWYPGVRVYQRENMNAPWDLQLEQVKDELDCMMDSSKKPVRDEFVFFHVGDDISYPQKMVKSLLRYNPNANITMCTDRDTPDVMGVHHRAEFIVDRDNLMFSRMRAFAQLRMHNPALYIDTDMIFVDRVSVSALLKDENVALCRREFGKDAIFNIEQRGLRFDEYEGKTLDELYPYVGCAVAMSNASLWHPVLEIYKTLPEKFKKWYGDQEALREYAKRFDHQDMPESVIGCLPEHKHDGAKILHFKGPSRKQLFEAM
jgi:tetratricopeptide (TPR) repeat protein